jgi:F0F1-type ATP synthase assembly protein I
MESSPKDNQKAYLKYTGLTAQIIAVFVVCYFIGNAIDQYFELQTPVVTILLLFAGIVSFLYKLVLDLSNTKKK